MRWFLNRRPSAAMTVALVALFMALTSGAYAMIKIPANSVGTKQLKNGAVTAPKVKQGSLLAKDFKAGQLPKGPKGDPGTPGAKGDPGTPGGTGPAGTARAYALVNANGTLNSLVPSHNVVSVSEPVVGGYCVELAPSVSAATTGAVVSPYHHGAATNALAQMDGPCGTNGQAVDTWTIGSGGTAVDASEGFFIVVP